MADQPAHCIYCCHEIPGEGPVFECPACLRRFEVVATVPLMQTDAVKAGSALSYAKRRVDGPRNRVEPNANRSLRCATLLAWLTPVPCFLAVLFGYRSLMHYPAGASYRGKFRAWMGVVMGIIGLFVAWPAAGYELTRWRGKMMRKSCEANMRQIGQARMLYEADDQHWVGRPVNTISVLMSPPYERNFICPMDRELSHSLESGSAKALPLGQRTSYVWIGQGMELKSAAAGYFPVWLFEPHSLHTEQTSVMGFSYGWAESGTPGDAVLEIQHAEDLRYWVFASTRPSTPLTEGR